MQLPLVAHHQVLHQLSLIVQEPVFLIQKLKLLVFVLDLKMVEKTLHLVELMFVPVVVKLSLIHI